MFQLMGLFYHVLHEGKPRQGLEAGTAKQELKQRPSRDAANWLAFHGLLSLLFLKKIQPRPPA